VATIVSAAVKTSVGGHHPDHGRDPDKQGDQGAERARGWMLDRFKLFR
jgi:hypothetical protein